jgi:hypothetical protein
VSFRRSTAGISDIWERLVKKGRHRRFEEARSLKRAIEVTAEPCPECGADPEDDHASWCLYESEELDDADEEEEKRYGGNATQARSTPSGEL